MSYLVLARKYRPQSFDDVGGQEHITEILKKAISSGRVHHAYLFSGPRGIGKTSCARILAKALNCEKGPAVDPCGKCPACVEITKGTSFDVIEIDGASNRGIDEIRTLRENVKFAPSYGRYKIYIIDEVHMLTTEAFNALLKTLEEPPEHVKFIFATTEPQKVPATIVSRCQRFDFKRVGVKTIIDALEKIAAAEKLSVDQSAFFAIAKAAQGSLRDALSVLDQLSSLSDREIRSEDVYSMLGLVELEHLFKIVDAIGNKNCSSALETLDMIIDDGKDLKQLMRDLTDHFRNLMVIKIGGKSLGKLVDYPVQVKEMILKQTELFSIEDILASIDTMIDAQETVRITESYRIPLEVALATLTYKESGTMSGQDQTPKPLPQSPLQLVKNKKGQIDRSPNEELTADKAITLDKKKQSDKVIDIELPNQKIINLDILTKNWDNLTQAVSQKKMSLATYLQDGIPCKIENEKISVGFSKACSFHKECLDDDSNRKLIDGIFSDFLKTRVQVRYVLADDLQKMKNDPAVENVINSFDGEITSKWHSDT